MNWENIHELETLTLQLRSKGSSVNNKVGDTCLNAGRKREVGTEEEGREDRKRRRKEIMAMKQTSNNTKWGASENQTSSMRMAWCEFRGFFYGAGKSWLQQQSKMSSRSQSTGRIYHHKVGLLTPNFFQELAGN